MRYHGRMRRKIQIAIIVVLLAAFAGIAWTIGRLSKTRHEAFNRVICLDVAMTIAHQKKDTLCLRDGLAPRCSEYWQDKQNPESAEIVREWHEAVQACSAR